MRLRAALTVLLGISATGFAAGAEPGDSKLMTQLSKLYLVFSPRDRTLIDTNVEAYATNQVGGVRHIYDLIVGGQVREFVGATSELWRPVTGADTYASMLVSPPNSGPYMFAGTARTLPQVWRYDDSRTWTPVTGTNTVILSLIVAEAGQVYILATNDPYGPAMPGQFQIWRYSGVGTSWVPVTNKPPSDDCVQVISVNDVMYMSGVHEGREAVWRHNVDDTWTALTGGNTDVWSIAGAGNTLFMIAANDLGPRRVWRYEQAPGHWTALTGPNTTPYDILSVDDGTLYMLASNEVGGVEGPMQVWQLDGGFAGDWTALTDPTASVPRALFKQAGQLVIAESWPSSSLFKYEGTPLQWSRL
jgi:hypothetical protein